MLRATTHASARHYISNVRGDRDFSITTTLELLSLAPVIPMDRVLDTPFASLYGHILNSRYMMIKCMPRCSGWSFHSHGGCLQERRWIRWRAHELPSRQRLTTQRSDDGIIENGVAQQAIPIDRCRDGCFFLGPQQRWTLPNSPRLRYY